MARRKSDDQNVFSLSFVDVFANTLGGLAFILILVILMIGLRFGIPRINTEQLPDAYQGNPYEVWLSANDGGGLYNWKIISGELPEGLEIKNASTGYIQGVPKLKDNHNSLETYKFTVKVDVGDTAKDKSDLKDYEIVVHSSPFGDLKIMTDKVIPKAVIGSDYPLVFSAQGGKIPYTWKIESPELKGLRINENGKLEGKIGGEPGKYNITVECRDQYGNSTSKKVEVEVIKLPEVPPLPPKLAIKTDSLPKAITGRKYRLALAAEGGYSPYKWSGSVEGTDLKINEKGYVTGTPKTTGEFYAHVEVKDREGNSQSKNSLKFTVLPAPREKIDPLTILSENPLPAAQANENYQLYLSATGGTPPYSWKIAKNGNNSEKISLTNHGKLTANFEQEGNYNIAVEVKDAMKLETSATLELNVKPAIPGMEIKTDKLPDAVKGFTYEGDLSAEGGYPPYTWSIKGELPEGLKLEDNKIKGLPTSAWQGDINIELKDKIGNTVAKNLGFEILESGEGSIVHKLEVLTDSLPTLLTGSRYEFFIATEGGGTPKNWHLDGNLPKGLSFENGRFYGKPHNKGIYNFSVKVSDPTGQEISRKYTLVLRSVVEAWWKPVALVMAIAAIVFLIIMVIIFIRIRKSKKLEISIVTQSIPNARCSFPYKVYLAATGGVPPYKWSISEGKLPDGLELKPEGIIEGEPLKGVKLNDIREINFEVKVTDSVGNSAKQPL